MNNKQLTINEQHGLDCHKEQLLLFSLVHLILCWAQNRNGDDKMSNFNNGKPYGEFQKETRHDIE